MLNRDSESSHSVEQSRIIHFYMVTVQPQIQDGKYTESEYETKRGGVEAEKQASRVSHTRTLRRSMVVGRNRFKSLQQKVENFLSMSECLVCREERLPELHVLSEV